MLAATFLLAVTVMMAPVHFQRHSIDVYPGGYQVAVADLNGDGRLDVVALSTEKDRMDWYENPTWKRRTIIEIDRPIDLAIHDIDGDGQPEIALASGFYFGQSTRGGEIQWLERPFRLDGAWAKRLIARDPVTHRIRFADLDGDGRKELIRGSIFGPGSQGPRSPKPAHLWAFRPPKDFAQANWEIEKIDETLTVFHGLWAGPLDNSSRESVLTASYEGIHRFRYEGVYPSGRWSKECLAPGGEPLDRTPGAARGTSEIVPVRLRGGQLLLAAIEPWHGHEVVVYASRPSAADVAGNRWSRRLIDNSLSEGHVLVAADFDGDGDDEIVAGWRGGQGGLTLYDFRDANPLRFDHVPLDRGIAAEGAAVADISGNGRLDLVVIAGRSKHLVWYENRP